MDKKKAAGYVPRKGTTRLHPKFLEAYDLKLKLLQDALPADRQEKVLSGSLKNAKAGNGLFPRTFSPLADSIACYFAKNDERAITFGMLVHPDDLLGTAELYHLVGREILKKSGIDIDKLQLLEVPWCAPNREPDQPIPSDESSNDAVVTLELREPESSPDNSRPTADTLNPNANDLSSVPLSINGLPTIRPARSRKSLTTRRRRSPVITIVVSAILAIVISIVVGVLFNQPADVLPRTPHLVPMEFVARYNSTMVTQEGREFAGLLPAREILDSPQTSKANWLKGIPNLQDFTVARRYAATRNHVGTYPRSLEASAYPRKVRCRYKHPAYIAVIVSAPYGSDNSTAAQYYRCAIVDTGNTSSTGDLLTVGLANSAKGGQFTVAAVVFPKDPSTPTDEPLVLELIQ